MMFGLGIGFRRVAAFFIDCVLLSGPLFIILWSAAFGEFVWRGVVSVSVLIGISLYFALWEALTGGQTPGKQMMQICVRRSDGSTARLYELLLRAFVLVWAPVIAELVYALVAYVFSVRFIFGVFAASLVAVSIIIWPISIVIGRGRVGLHDLLSRTAVFSTGGENTPPSGPIVDNAYLQHVVAVVILAVVISAWPLYETVRAIQYGAEQFAVRGQIHVKDFQAYTAPQLDINWLLRNIHNAGIYLESISFRVSSSEVVKDEVNKFKFDESAVPWKRDQLNAFMAGVTKVVAVDVLTTRRGYMSGDFQRTLAVLVMQAIGEPHTLYAFHFGFYVPVGAFVIMPERVLIGGVGPRYKEGEAPLIAEPDFFSRVWVSIFFTQGQEPIEW